MGKEVSIGFDRKGVLLPIASILPVKELRPSQKFTEKYLQVLSSVREVGIIEPLIVFPENGKSDQYVLLDGHVRLEVLKQLGETEARCLVSTDDEAYTYNKRVNRMSTIQEHFMILKAIRSQHSSEARFAKWHLRGSRGAPQAQACHPRCIFLSEEAQANPADRGSRTLDCNWQFLQAIRKSIGRSHTSRDASRPRETQGGRRPDAGTGNKDGEGDGGVAT